MVPEIRPLSGSGLVLLAVTLLPFFNGMESWAGPWDTNVFTSAEQILQMSGSQQPPVLVDIRPPEAFEKCRIPGSINIPLAFVKTKTFLKKTRLVLVSRGYGQRFIEPECRRLQGLGFEAVILLGGLCAWRQAGGVLAGDLTALNLPPGITPRRFFQEKEAPYWLIVDTSPPGEQNPPEPFTAAVRIFPSDGVHTVLAKIEKAARDSGGGALLTVLAASPEGQNDVRLERISAKARGLPVVFLEGGLQNYRRFLTRQNLAIRAGNRHPQTAGNCLPCRRRK